MILPLLISLLLAPQSIRGSSSLTFNNGPDEALLMSGQYFKYVRAIEQELMQSPSNANLHASLALGYHLLGQRRFCDEEMQQALALVDPPPVSPAGTAMQVHYLAGRLAMEDTKFQLAVSHFQTALLLDPANSKIEYFLGASLQALNQHASAKSHFEHACQATAYSWPCRALAELELDDGNATSAQTHAAQALHIEPTSPESQLVAGKVAQALGNTSDALAFFHRAAELNQSWEAPHYFLSHLYQKMPAQAAEAARELALYQELFNANQ